ncbi:hypothetical protein C8F04DRAFT_1253428 [Mycena alexandri]|uniref:Uncharacterized protein n=1 Tax=Mycena alexandri TaxID=1745969 RepID=A0AAD6T7K0_9AGAR|nr:hypothetical protein C8F04DRAFT_1253428 [Mycena alexandri]
MLIGVTLNVLLMGVIIMQMHIYFTTYSQQTSRDGRWLNSFLAFVFFANLLNTGFAVADLYLALVSHFGDFAYLKVSTWLFATDPVIVVSGFAILPAVDIDAGAPQGTSSTTCGGISTLFGIDTKRSKSPRQTAHRYPSSTTVKEQVAATTAQFDPLTRGASPYDKRGT